MINHLVMPFFKKQLILREFLQDRGKGRSLLLVLLMEVAYLSCRACSTHSKRPLQQEDLLFIWRWHVTMRGRKQSSGPEASQAHNIVHVWTQFSCQIKESLWFNTTSKGPIFVILAIIIVSSGSVISWEGYFIFWVVQKSTTISENWFPLGFF